MSDHKQIIRAAWLQAATPEAAYNWLDERSQNPNGEFVNGDAADALEELLLLRNDPIIDLGLASFGTSLKVARALFRSEAGKQSDAVRLAILANATLSERNFPSLPFGLFDDDDVFNKEVVATWVRHAPLVQIEALIGNPEISDSFLTDLLSGTGCWNDVPEDAHLAALNALAENPRLGKKYSGLAWDGEAEYDFGKITSGIWELTATAPVTPPWAYRISKLLGKIEERQIENTLEVASRWFPTSEFNYFEKIDGKIGLLAIFQEIRFYLARTALNSGRQDGDRGFLRNSDIALRCAAYSKLVLSGADLRTAFADDGFYVFHHALKNQHIWRREDSRTTLRELALSGDSGLVPILMDEFEKLEEAHRAEHPEWFGETPTEQFWGSNEAPLAI